jgi:hypothetical protein
LGDVETENRARERHGVWQENKQEEDASKQGLEEALEIDRGLPRDRLEVEIDKLVANYKEREGKFPETFRKTVSDTIYGAVEHNPDAGGHIVDINRGITDGTITNVSQPLIMPYEKIKYLDTNGDEQIFVHNESYILTTHNAPDQETLEFVIKYGKSIAARKAYLGEATDGMQRLLETINTKAYEQDIAKLKKHIGNEYGRAVAAEKLYFRPFEDRLDDEVLVIAKGIDYAVEAMKADPELSIEDFMDELNLKGHYIGQNFIVEHTRSLEALADGGLDASYLQGVFPPFPLSKDANEFEKGEYKDALENWKGMGKQTYLRGINNQLSPELQQLFNNLNKEYEDKVRQGKIKDDIFHDLPEDAGGAWLELSEMSFPGRVTTTQEGGVDLLDTKLDTELDRERAKQQADVVAYEGREGPTVKSIEEWVGTSADDDEAFNFNFDQMMKEKPLPSELESIKEAVLQKYPFLSSLGMEDIHVVAGSGPGFAEYAAAGESSYSHIFDDGSPIIELRNQKRHLGKEGIIEHTWEEVLLGELLHEAPSRSNMFAGFKSEFISSLSKEQHERIKEKYDRYVASGATGSNFDNYESYLYFVESDAWIRAYVLNEKNWKSYFTADNKIPLAKIKFLINSKSEEDFIQRIKKIKKRRKDLSKSKSGKPTPPIAQ